MQTLTTNPKVSFGNKKLPKTTLIFNLPAVNTCPGKTEFCKKNCYALKAERIYPQVLPARKHNLKLTLTENFIPSMIETIQKDHFFKSGKNKGKAKIETVRIHESGDFYSQAYLNAWYVIALEFPSIKFYAYTKSFHLNFAGKPSNFVLIGSFDETSTNDARILHNEKRAYFNNTFSIVGKKEQASCIQDCTTCNLCWMGNDKNLTVNLH